MKNPYLADFGPIWAQAKHVKIDQARLNQLAAEWAREKEWGWIDWDLPGEIIGDRRNFMQFLGITTALNFCYTDPQTTTRFQITNDGQIISGSAVLNFCFLRALFKKKMPLLDADFLREISPEQVEEIFEGGTALPLLGMRWSALKALGYGLQQHLSGQFGNLNLICGNMAFSSEENREVGIIDFLVNHFPIYRDSRIHQPTGSILHFHKKAHLFVLLYHGQAMRSSGNWPPIKDIDRVGPPVDYRLPQTLREEGALVYAPSLAERVDRQIKIIAGSEEEIEIRAMTTRSVWNLFQIINGKRELNGDSPINMCQLDYRLWKAGRNCKKPHHLTETTDY